MRFAENGTIIDLESKVIYNNICCYCGACGAFCPEYITYENQIPVTKKKCFEIHGACFDFCPRSFLPFFEMEKEIFENIRSDAELGYYTRILSVKASGDMIIKTGQDGGVVTALLTYLMDKGEIDAACVCKKSDHIPWKPEPFVATTTEEILTCSGSKYEQTPMIVAVADAINNYETIAMVALPCHVQAIRKIQLSKAFDVGAGKVKYVIGLFCTETFNRDLLLAKLAEIGVDIDKVNKFDISAEGFKIYTDDGMITENIKAMESCVREGCNVCYDFAAELADISVGSVGSEDGWNTVIVRSKIGEELIDGAKKAGVIKVKPMDEKSIELVRSLASGKKKENMKKIMQIADAVKILNLVVEPQHLHMLLKDCTTAHNASRK